MSMLTVTRKQAAFEMTKRLLAEENDDILEAADPREALLTILDDDVNVLILDAESSEGHRFGVRASYQKVKSRYQSDRCSR